MLRVVMVTGILVAVSAASPSSVNHKHCSQCSHFCYSAEFGKCDRHNHFNIVLREEESREHLNMPAPKLIIFDLDYTLWPFWVDTHVSAPFEKKDGQVTDRYGHHVHAYPETERVLEKVKAEGISIGVASRTDDPPAGRELIQVMGWEKYFDYKEIYPGNKTTHFKRFHENSGVAYKDMLFFDDEARNIRDISKLGVTCILVNNGMSINVLEEGLQQHAKQAQTS